MGSCCSISVFCQFLAGWVRTLQALSNRNGGVVTKDLGVVWEPRLGGPSLWLERGTAELSLRINCLPCLTSLCVCFTSPLWALSSKTTCLPHGVVSSLWIFFSLVQQIPTGVYESKCPKRKRLMIPSLVKWCPAQGQLALTGGPGHMAQTMAGNLLSRSFPIPWEESGWRRKEILP